MCHTKTLPISLLKFLKKTTLLSVLLINISIEASTFEHFFTEIVFHIIASEYTEKNIEAFNNFMKNHSFEDLISSAEQSNQKAQEILFSLYYLNNRPIDTFKMIDNKVIKIIKIIKLTPKDLHRMRTFTETTSTPAAYFAQGLYYTRSGDYEKGMTYLDKAKEAGHALAHLYILIFRITEQTTITPITPTDTKTNQKNIDIVYAALKEMESKGITITGFDFLIGITSYIKGLYTDARQYLEKVITKNHPLFTIPSYGYLGKIYQMEGQNTLAKEHFITAINKGYHGVKSYLLDIYIKEGNYKSAIELLKDISLHWGVYNDVVAIKASVLLSHILEKGLGTPQDLRQSYVWITRAQKIYNLSINPNIPKLVDPDTGRYVLQIQSQQDNVNNSQIIKSKKKYKTKKQEIENPFTLFNFLNTQKNISDMTSEQLKAMKLQIDILTKKLITRGEFQKAYTVANTTFENLHLPGGGRCEGIWQ